MQLLGVPKLDQKMTHGSLQPEGQQETRKKRWPVVKSDLFIKLVMQNQYYTFDNVNWKQTKGKAIRNKLTNIFGKLLIKRHDKKYFKLLSKLNVENDLFERYVDDSTDGLAAIYPGVSLMGRS